MSDPIETYNYDRLGNRTTVEVGTDNYDYDYFQDMNRLHRVTKGTDKTEFTYNVFGAVTKIEKFDGQTLTHREEWEYANSTVPKRFTKHNIAEQYSDVEYASPDATSYDAQRWLWQYRKGAFDTREQKRLLISPHGDGTDDNDDDYAHLWEYSLSGVAGELYVLYKGLQTATTTEPNENKSDAGRRVYISPFKYYAAGGELQFQTDGTTKEVHITDNLGSVRSIVIWDSGGLKDIKGFDYKPFGELDGGDEPTKHGFATAEYDGESSCFAMGMRMYSAELGRFLSVDPLFEAMPRHNPYHYSFNSPLVWKDPSGLAPEKEQDRLMSMSDLFGYTADSHDNYIQSVTEVDFAGALVRAFNKEMDERANATQSAVERGRLGAEWSGDNGILIRYYEKVVKEDGTIIGNHRHARYYQGQLYNEDGSDYIGNDEFVQKIYGWIMDLLATGDPEIICRIETLESSPRGHWIQETSDWNYWNTVRAEDTEHGSEPRVPVGSNVSLAPNTPIWTFAHEFLGHSFQYDTGTNDWRTNIIVCGNHEAQAVNIENVVRYYYGIPKRTSYQDCEIPDSYLWDTHRKYR